MGNGVVPQSVTTKLQVVPNEGLEPSAYRLQGGCSTAELIRLLTTPMAAFPISLPAVAIRASDNALRNLGHKPLHPNPHLDRF